MKSILCFGDSNTFGFVPVDGSRYQITQRWSGILKKHFEDKFNVIEAGCNNRTCIADNPSGELFTGYKAIMPYLESHNSDLALVIIALGVNDLQFAYNLSALKVAEGLKKIISCIKQKTKANILVLIPDEIGKNVLNSFFSQMFDESSIEKSKYLPDLLESAAKETGCYFLNLNKIAKTSEKDGLHYEPAEHEKIANLVCEKISEIFATDF